MDLKSIVSILDRLYPNPTTEITWNIEKKGDLYALCVALVLSPQCRDATVTKIMKQLYDENLHLPEAVLENPERVAEIIKPSGFKSKVKYVIEISEKFHSDEKWINLRKTSEDVTFKDLITLKGIGRKCAGVIQSCLGQNPDIFPVDTHIRRCAKRWNLTKETNVNLISRNLQQLFPKNEWSKRHFQIVLYGRYFCKAKNHSKCEICESLR